LYHLEHHLYPAVPHHHWPELARRLDPYLDAADIAPVKLWI
jgi:beta-carotene hydroxylase